MSRSAIIKILVFVVVVVIGDRVGGGLMQSLFMRTQFRFASIYKGELPSSIAVLGNSRGLHMFHPPAIESITGEKVANLAFNGTPAVVLPVLWEDYLKHHQPPEMLILEVSCVGIEELPGSVDMYSILGDQNERFLDLIESRNLRNGYACQISRLYRYNSSLMWRSLLFSRRSDQGWIMNSSLNDAGLKQAIETSQTELLRIQENVDALKEVLDVAEQAGVEVKCVFAPYLPAYYERLQSPQEWRRWLEEELGVEILDQTRLLAAPENFGDHLHLNETGAKELAEILDGQGFFDR